MSVLLNQFLGNLVSNLQTNFSILKATKFYSRHFIVLSITYFCRFSGNAETLRGSCTDFGLFPVYFLSKKGKTCTDYRILTCPPKTDPQVMLE